MVALVGGRWTSQSGGWRDSAVDSHDESEYTEISFGTPQQ